LELPNKLKKEWIDDKKDKISLNRQLSLLGVSKTAYYYKPALEKEINLILMEKMDKIYTECPFYGSRRMQEILKRQGYNINRKRISRLMNIMGLKAIYPKKNLSKMNPNHKKFPYLLKNVNIHKVNQVWSTDITYIPIKGGFFYLTVIMDWYSRYILSWRLSNTLDMTFCIEALEEALTKAKPEIFNTDQGVQYTSKNFINILEKQNITISMDGKGRAFDNIFVERLWRSIKYEEVYIKRYENGKEAKKGLTNYIMFYNKKRPHQSLGYATPYEEYFELKKEAI